MITNFILINFTPAAKPSWLAWYAELGPSGINTLRALTEQAFGASTIHFQQEASNVAGVVRSV
jgi:hypothetical protein